MSFEYFGDHHTRALYDYRIITKELYDELVESRKEWENREQDIFVVQSAVKNESAVSDN